MISRILTRLAIVWMVGLGGVVLVFGMVHGALATADWGTIGALVLGPAVLALALAWIFAPTRQP